MGSVGTISFHADADIGSEVGGVLFAERPVFEVIGGSFCDGLFYVDGRFAESAGVDNFYIGTNNPIAEFCSGLEFFPCCKGECIVGIEKGISPFIIECLVG